MDTVRAPRVATQPGEPSPGGVQVDGNALGRNIAHTASKLPWTMACCACVNLVVRTCV